MKELSDKLWRLRNLYSCRTEGTGRAVEFRPRPEQEVLFRHLAEQPQVPAFIIKSRRLGISTAMGIYNADGAVFSSGWRGVLIDRTQADATKKMVEQIRFSVDSLPDQILSRMVVDKRNDGELRLRLKDDAESADSVVWATTSARGGDATFLHVSEWGPIAALDPPRSNEIRTGAFPSARLGSRVVETTWYGGKVGDLWEMVRPILESDPNADGVVYFFPWHGDPAAVRTAGRVTDDVEHYFRELAGRCGKTFSQEQKRWYAAKAIEQGMFMRREYPSTLDEAFSAPVEGSIYGDCIDRLRAGGGVARYEVDKSALVHTSWDLGNPLNTVTWFWQVVGHEIRIVDVDLELDLTATDRVARILGRGWPLGTHFLPHDADAKGVGGTSARQVLEAAGMKPCKCLPRTHDVWVGVNELRQIFPRLTFRVPECDAGLARLAAYRAAPVSTGGISRDDPVHDRASHAADALRVMAEALKLGLVATSTRQAALAAAGRRGVVVEWGVGG